MDFESGLPVAIDTKFDTNPSLTLIPDANLRLALTLKSGHKQVYFAGVADKVSMLW
jgi:hypothetical protein